MKPSSFGRLAVAAAWILLLSAFTKSDHASPQKFRDASYFYYFEEDDSYDACNTVAGEIAHLQQLTGCVVNTNPFGGTLLANGYYTNDYPHDDWPASHLYLHH